MRQRSSASSSAGQSRLVVACLIASLAVNVVLLWRVSRSPRAAAAPPAAPAEQPGASSGVADASCARQLEACLQANTGLAIGAGLWRARAYVDPLDPPPAAAPTTPTADDADRAQRRAALCQVARDKLHEQWVDKRDAITLALTTGLGDEAQQRNDAMRDADRAADALALPAAARGGFERQFVEARQGQLKQLAIAAGPPVDWSALLEGTRTLFDAEDAVVLHQVGADALASYRSSELGQRLTILSILATYAGADWEDGVIAP